MRRELLKYALAAFAAGAFDAMTMAGAAERGNPFGEEGDGRAELGPFALPAGVRIERDLAYGNDPRQRLDVYIPSGARNAPVLVMVHGGGWSRGTKNLWRVVKNKVTHWTGKGFVFVSINYRMAPQADPVTQADDVAQALAFVQAHLASWGGDPARVVLMGHSSGAHLVSLLSADAGIGARFGVKPWCATVALDSAAMNVDQIMRRRHFALYDHVFKTDPAYWQNASPTLRLKSAPVAPMLLVCSSQRADSCPQARAFAARATELGGRATVLPVALSHPQINDYLSAASSYTSSVDEFLGSVGVR